MLQLGEVVEAVRGEDQVVGRVGENRGVAVHDLELPVGADRRSLVFGLADPLGARVHALDPARGAGVPESKLREALPQPRSRLTAAGPPNFFWSHCGHQRPSIRPSFL